jgi:hypothetical protein
LGANKSCRWLAYFAAIYTTRFAVAIVVPKPFLTFTAKRSLVKWAANTVRATWEGESRWEERPGWSHISTEQKLAHSVYKGVWVFALCA